MALVNEKAKGELRPTSRGVNTKDEDGLTLKLRNFVMAFHETGNASESYRRAYNAKNMSAPVIHNKASQLLAKDEVRVMLEKLKRESAERHNITIDTITQMLKEDRDLAKENGQASAAVSATFNLAKLHGLITEKVKSDVDQRTTHNVEPTSAFAELIGRAKRSRAEGDA